MSGISREALFGKLNPIAYQSIESATVFCKMRGNPYVELVHWVAQLVQTPGTDLEAIVRHYELESSTLARDITAALDRLPRGSTSIVDFSEHIEASIKNGWLYGTLMFGQAQVRTGFLVIGILQMQNLYRALTGISRQFERIKVDDLSDNFLSICGRSSEAPLGAQDGSALNAGMAGVGAEPGTDSGAMAPAAMCTQESLLMFCVYITVRARAG
jgi:type VI secretion system protein VasG